MLIKTLNEKINLKRYFLLSGGSTLIFFCFAKNLSEIYGILIVYAGTIINQIMLIEGVSRLVRAASGDKLEFYDKRKMILYFVLKMFILFLAIYISVQFMGKRVIIPVLNYVVQILVLSVSLKNKGSN